MPADVTSPFASVEFLLTAGCTFSLLIHRKTELVLFCPFSLGEPACLWAGRAAPLALGLQAVPGTAYREMVSLEKSADL